MATQSDIIFILDYLAAAYDIKNIDEKTIRAWSNSFLSVPRMWIVRHAMKWIESEKWMPKISEIRYKVDQEMRGLDKDTTYWQSPTNPQDEACMWLCFKKGCGPDELTARDIVNLYQKEDDHEFPDNISPVWAEWAAYNAG